MRVMLSFLLLLLVLFMNLLRKHNRFGLTTVVRIPVTSVVYCYYYSTFKEPPYVRH